MHVRLWHLLLGLLCCLSHHMHAAELPFVPDPRNQTAGRDCDVAIACVFQNEGPWLREWIEYYRLLGVSHFYLYNNLSSDSYLSTLGPYIESGVVELYDFPVKDFYEHQQDTYTHALELARGHSNWVAIIDVDEFIVPLITDDLVSYLKIFPENVGGIEINWQCFGTSDIWSLLPGELLIDKLYLKAPYNEPMNQWEKSIVRPHAVKACDSPHYCLYVDGYKVLRVTPVDSRGIPLDELSVQAIRIHHYILRTKEFFYKVKVPRLKHVTHNFLKGMVPSEYMATTNQVEDRSIQKFVPQLKAILFSDQLVHTHGYWLGKESPSQHRFDPALAHLLTRFFRKERAEKIIDFGCGIADYVRALENMGFTCVGVDGNPNTPELTRNAGFVVDLSQPVDLEERYDWGLSLAVGASIPPQFEKTFIENLAKHCTRGIIISWPSLDTVHQEAVNKNEAIEQQMANLGFMRDLQAEDKLRNGATFATFRYNLMVFRSS